MAENETSDYTLMADQARDAERELVAEAKELETGLQHSLRRLREIQRASAYAYVRQGLEEPIETLEETLENWPRMQVWENMLEAEA